MGVRSFDTAVKVRGKKNGKRNKERNGIKREKTRGNQQDYCCCTYIKSLNPRRKWMFCFPGADGWNKHAVLIMKTISDH